MSKDSLALEIINRREPMRSYYFSFDRTGVKVIDDILAAVAAAGKGVHSTEHWGEYPDEEFTYIDAIQYFAERAAKQFNKEATDA